MLRTVRLMVAGVLREGWRAGAPANHCTVVNSVGSGGHNSFCEFGCSVNKFC